MMGSIALRAGALAAAVLVFSGCSSMQSQPLTLAEQGYFFVSGGYSQNKAGQIMSGQMFVQYQVPKERKHPYPVVMWHGGGQTGTNFLGTPDGRKGWAEYFLEQGYAVYVVDQPGRARSGFFAEVYGATRRATADYIAHRFTAPETFNDYPQAKHHTQWPGKGVAGDPIFDQFYASQVESIADSTLTEKLNREAGAALLDRIGPAIVMTHSQSGGFGWAIADARPKLVKGILAVEPNGPPFHEIAFTGSADYKDGPFERPWGITRGAMAYSPATSDPKDLKKTQQAKPDGPDLYRCWLQGGTPRQLVNLQGVPILVLVSEASYHAPYDHCTSRYLNQAGVKHDFVRLPDVGIRGNGHMMMLEKNNLEIAAFMANWVGKNVK